MPVSVTEVINGVSIPKVAYTLRAKVEFIFPADSSTQNRKDLLKILEKALAETQINGVLTTLDRLSG
jgi:aspartate carbamoyltransferase regulatory subunit